MNSKARIPVLFLTMLAACLGSGCKSFKVDLGTQEPLQVDINVRLDVYQFGDESEEAQAARKSYQEVAERKRNRMAEIQDLKNSRLVGENHHGLISIRNLPAGEYGKYVHKTVEEENADRVFLMTSDANRRGEDLVAVQREQWEQWQQNSFPGEWFEVGVEEEEGAHRWIQKAGVLR
ncbi:MAG: DUF1318 domain-containing protein [Verrucomicrobiales bacterium]